MADTNSGTVDDCSGCSRRHGRSQIKFQTAARHQRLVHAGHRVQQLDARVAGRRVLLGGGVADVAGVHLVRRFRRWRRWRCTEKMRRSVAHRGRLLSAGDVPLQVDDRVLGHDGGDDGGVGGRLLVAVIVCCAIRGGQRLMHCWMKINTMLLQRQ